MWAIRTYGGQLSQRSPGRGIDLVSTIRPWYPAFQKGKPRSRRRRGPRSGGCGLVGEHGDTVADELRVEQAQRLLRGSVAEQALALAEQDWEDHQAQLVDEIALEQALDQLGATGDEDDPVDLAVQPRHLVRQVAAEDGRVLPARFLQGR